ncbi:unnamed protein product [Darwinula stevensoni]|uniref:C2H2-type domain-containing protein n=1 Tax=Darwinula stevensoni TaxID=69355 RepID=A0A7R8X9B3_9CRUS|nr:unnamed protein product [Darwinula stevensoni]CAG0890928.1 unnamed protein product [Darwinula stevensoni]
MYGIRHRIVEEDHQLQIVPSVSTVVFTLLTNCQMTIEADVEYAWSGRTWDDARIHFCSLCAFCSAKKTDVTRHIRTHTGERPYACDECGRSFSRKTHLNRHRTEQVAPLVWCGMTWSEFRLYFCGVCNYRSVSKRSVSKHVLTHTGERPYKCEECGRGFSDPSNLTRHCRTLHPKLR